MIAAPTVFVPLDSAAVALGANPLADAFVHEGARVIRTGSRGMHWLEPLVEVEIGGERVGFGPLAASEAASVLAAVKAGKAGAHGRYLGPTNKLDWMKRQTRLIFERCGVIDPTDLDGYRRNGGLAASDLAMQMHSSSICEAILASGLRGRGGAGFPAGIKWRTVAQENSDRKYVICNADEGDSGTFADRMIMEGDPFLLIEGMLIAAFAVGAEEGFIYLRSEYPIAQQILGKAISLAYEEGLLGANAGGTGRIFDLSLFIGAGAYICGEETSLLNSLEGRRGEVRAKPPIPAVSGLFGRPTLVQNVLSFCAVPAIIERSATSYAALGLGKSTGTMPFQISGDVKRPGLFESPFGLSIREVVEDIAGGTRSGRPIRAVQIGGPLGAYLPPSQFDTRLDYEELAQIGAGIGHGGIVVYNDTVDFREQARYAFEFCAIESCGKCTPCRIGAVRGVELMDKIASNPDNEGEIELLRDLCALMVDGSLCAMGGMTPVPVISALTHFPDDFAAPSIPRMTVKTNS